MGIRLQAVLKVLCRLRKAAAPPSRQLAVGRSPGCLELNRTHDPDQGSATLKKLYEGINTPSYQQVRFSLDWICPKCGSGDVDIVPTAGVRPFFDGGPSTRDENSLWMCKSCNEKTEGREMHRTREMLQITKTQKAAERAYFADIKYRYDR